MKYRIRYGDNNEKKKKEKEKEKGRYGHFKMNTECDIYFVNE